MSEESQIPEIVVEKKQPETPVFDLMDGAARWEVKIHEHGLVALLDVMPRFAPVGKTADFAIVQAARVSYGEGTKQVSEDRGLIRYLARHRHTTPFEMVEFKFHHVMPIFVARQWIRHRTANVNEYSARYSVVKDRFYRPSVEGVRQQSKTNRQGGEGPADISTAEDNSTTRWSSASANTDAPRRSAARWAGDATIGRKRTRRCSPGVASRADESSGRRTSTQAK